MGYMGRQDVDCCWVTHDGEGEPSEPDKVTVLNVLDSEEAAREAAAYFDEQEDRRQRYDGHDHVENTSQVIEVRWPDRAPSRFRVRCRVVRKYEATEER